MASLIYNSASDDLARNNIDFDTNTFKAMLVTSAYTPSRDADLKRSNITNEVVGTGYTAGGATSIVSVTKDTTNDRTIIQFGPVFWASSTIIARGVVYYKARGGASSLDELVAYLDLGYDMATNIGTFSLSTSTITLQNQE
jgi:hypothetical protein